MINIILKVILIIIFNRLLYLLYIKIIFLDRRLLLLKLYKSDVELKKSYLPGKFSIFQIKSVPFGFHKNFGPKNKSIENIFYQSYQIFQF